MGQVIGINLGRSRAVMAAAGEQGARIVEHSDGTRFMPSAVGVGLDGSILVGTEALGQWRSRPRDTVIGVMHLIGRPFVDADVQEYIALVSYAVRTAAKGNCEIVLGDRAFAPEEIAAFILEALKREAEDWFREPVTHAVITVPAYFGQRQRTAVGRAAGLAGLTVTRILDEPEAAALAYGLHPEPGDLSTTLVYDLGGRTFDATVLLASAGTFMDLGKTGSQHLGGETFNQHIFQLLLDDARRQTGGDLSDSPVALKLLDEAADRVRITLSRRDRVTMNVPAIPYGPRGRTVDVSVDLTRAQYEDLIRAEVDETLRLVRSLLASVHFTHLDIDRVIVIGGASSTPLVIQALEAEFGSHKLLRNINPPEAVALGAAVQSAIITDHDATDAADDVSVRVCQDCGRLNLADRPDCRSCSSGAAFGTPEVVVYQSIPRAIGFEGAGGSMEVLLAERTIFPTATPAELRLRTIAPGQRLVQVPLYEGNERLVRENGQLGEVLAVLQGGLPAATELIVSVGIDRDGIVRTAVRVPTAPNGVLWTSFELAPRAGARPPRSFGSTITSDPSAGLLGR